MNELVLDQLTSLNVLFFSAASNSSRKFRKLVEQEEKAQKRKNKIENRRYRRPSKQEISLPCGFQHVVSVNLNDSTKYFSMQVFLDSDRAELASRRQSTTDLRRQSTADLSSMTSHMAKLSVFNSCSELNC